MDEFWLGAFWELCSCRDFGQGSGPIPFTALTAYAEFARLDRDNTKLFIAVMRELDEVYMTQLRQEQKRRQGK